MRPRRQCWEARVDESTRETLELVCQKADELMREPFTKFLLEGNKIRFRFSSSKGGPLLVETWSPEHTDIKSFSMTLRWFMEAKESTSFRSLALLLCSPELSTRWKEQFRRNRRLLNEYLDSNSPFSMGDTTYTHRKIIDTFFYGDLFHADQRATWAEWKESGVFGPIQTEFCGVLTRVLDHVRCLASTCREELNRDC